MQQQVDAIGIRQNSSQILGIAEVFIISRRTTADVVMDYSNA